jgi:NAD(P)-dependent dehydrogenase (short-subunit alcohol dehydrogenase family)
MAQNKWRLDDKKAFITGGTRGIGKAVIEEFLELGAEVITTARHAEELKACIKSWGKQGFRVQGIAADVSNAEDRLKLVDFVRSRWDLLDILVNNAGVNFRKPTLEYSAQEVEGLFQTNLISAFELSRLCFSLLQASQNACITNISSVAGLVHLRSGSPYGMTKAAMLQLTRNLAVEWAPHGIRVNAVAPGFTETPLTEYWKQFPELMELARSKIPLGRMGTPTEIAGAITYTALPIASYMTGQCLTVDGGLIVNVI